MSHSSFNYNVSTISSCNPRYQWRLSNVLVTSRHIMWWRRHSPSPDMKRRCWIPWRTESANVKLTKALMFRWSTRDNQESYWDCRGSDGKVSGRVEGREMVRYEKYSWRFNWSVFGFREGEGKRRPGTTDIQVKGESREVGMTELELEAQHERDTRQDAEMWGGTEREGCEHKWQRRQNVRQRERYRGAQAGRQVINHPKNINMYVESNPETTSASSRDNSCGSLSSVRPSTDS